jgi:hypothetical protein
VQSLYLEVRGAGTPSEAPEIYFRFVKRTLERHGGVALGSSWHRGKAVLDKGRWRADIRATGFGTAEIISRTVLDGAPAYSQHAYLHFLTDEDAEGLEPEPESPPPPEGWSALVFPPNPRNDMPFRGLQTGESASFTLETGGVPVESAAAYLVEASPGRGAPRPVEYDAASGYTVSPADDPTLKVTSGPMGGSGESKQMVAVAELPGGGTASYTLQVTRSRWSYRDLGAGAGILLACGVSGWLLAWRRRRSFKYNGYEGPAAMALAEGGSQGGDSAANISSGSSAEGADGKGDQDSRDRGPDGPASGAGA